MMLTQYTYIKQRQQFGKQCLFTVSNNVAVENIDPNPGLMQNYIMSPICHQRMQFSAQLAAHEAQTTRRIIINTGLLHVEGGWPKEVNARDSEVVQRFRRRVEKEDSWALSMNNLLSTMKGYVLQNNAVNIYQNFFDDLIPTSMAKEYNMRITNLYEDPEAKTRPIRHLSWSPNGSNRLAAAYGFLEFEEHSTDVNPYSYVWDIENPNKALYTLKSSSSLMTVEFNSRDPVLLVSGLISGQVCCWDIRTSYKPVQMSHPYTSHRCPATQTLWIPTKVNTEFFSSSTDGVVLWWDTRSLKSPTETLVMDLQHPSKANILEAVGVTTLQFEQTISSKFLAGTENGLVLSVNRRGNSPAEKLAIRFECYTGPVVAIDRNPIYTKNFLTIGNWSAKIWADDTKEGCVLSTRLDEFNSCSELSSSLNAIYLLRLGVFPKILEMQKFLELIDFARPFVRSNKTIDLSGGCWSRSRSSVFFTINTEGMLEAYDILAGMNKPLIAIRVCSNSLTAISSDDDGELLAVGSRNGTVYLLECSQDLMSFTKEDRLALSNYFEKCSRFEKAIDNRLKEIRLLLGSAHDVSPSPVVRELKTKAKKKEQKEKKKEKQMSTVEKEKLESRKKSKGQRPRGKTSAKISVYPELVEAETNYFGKVEELSKKFVELDESDVQAAQEWLIEREVTLPKPEETESDKEEVKKRKSIRKIKSRTRTIKSSLKSREDLEEKRSEDADLESIRTTGTRREAKKILKKSCAMKICRPKICCMDLEEKRRAKWLKKLKERPVIVEEEPERRKSTALENKLFRRITDYIADIPQPSRAMKKRIFTLKDAPPIVSRGELEEAKKEMRVWREKALARKLSSWTVEKKLAVKSERKIEAKREPEEPEEAAKPVSEVKDPKRPVQSDQFLRKARRSRKKSRRLRLTKEDIKEQEEEDKKKRWKMLKHKMKQYDEPHKHKRYPRISAAFVRTHSETMLQDSEERKE
ncbi:Dynein intermediate chain 3, ciliary [Habropoda laboriosa]|uniref:Dynein intermediate chain 3, ciliary n=1 Tax=Habropoda laboriosa TaxID=597456 RepID=A0A0L7QR36_9HYME|nr:Dynein intermediate chain 3, ciliary [Habropoda laboriosa]